ncbi:unnamed protein product [Agarophyton chilense]|eukprot:gb/GEZJ01005321.1/.p1 GENE.gb/GEZJ01005321.1/~~gb/GEZJ01005321.1/.p1  ORF type:complete len:328 (-),score=24.89 gb/GEZJ01005321.1/:704-1687(-)
MDPTLLMLLRLLLLLGLSATARARSDACPTFTRSDQWTVSPWGPQDEIGAANRITPHSVLAASKLVTIGKTYNLGIVTDADTPSFPPRTLSITLLRPNQFDTRGVGANGFSFNDDIVSGWLGVGSQIDGLGHVGIRGVHYNGFNVSSFLTPVGLTKLGLEKLPPLVTRGVLLDMAAFYNQSIVPEGTAYTRRHIIVAARQQRVQIRPGDTVLFHSGWLGLLDGPQQNQSRFISFEPGLAVSGAEYLAEIGVVAVGADTWGLEAVPFESGECVFPVHQILMSQHGIFILENMDVREMVSDKVREFMFVLGPTRLRGTAQMMVNPTAIH